jgi:hypothetical protein
LRAATEVGGVALLMDAKDERAAKWYSSYGALADAPLSPLLPLATEKAALRLLWETLKQVRFVWLKSG